GNVSASVKTIAFWVKVSTTTVRDNIIDLSGGGRNIEIVNNTVQGNGITSPTIYVDGVVASTIKDTGWHHIAITSNSTINCNAVALGVVGGIYFGGTIDDLRMYNSALSAATVKRLAQLGI